MSCARKNAPIQAYLQGLKMIPRAHLMQLRNDLSLSPRSEELEVHYQELKLYTHDYQEDVL